MKTLYRAGPQSARELVLADYLSYNLLLIKVISARVEEARNEKSTAYACSLRTL